MKYPSGSDISFACFTSDRVTLHCDAKWFPPQILHRMRFGAVCAECGLCVRLSNFPFTAFSAVFLSSGDENDEGLRDSAANFERHSSSL